MAFQTDKMQIDGSLNVDGSIFQFNQLFTPGGGGSGDVAWASGNVGTDNQIITSAGDGSIVSESNLSFNTNLLQIGTSSSSSTFSLGSSTTPSYSWSLTHKANTQFEIGHYNGGNDSSLFSLSTVGDANFYGDVTTPSVITDEIHLGTTAWESDPLMQIGVSATSFALRVGQTGDENRVAISHKDGYGIFSQCSNDTTTKYSLQLLTTSNSLFFYNAGELKINSATNQATGHASLYLNSTGTGRSVHISKPNQTGDALYIYTENDGAGQNSINAQDDQIGELFRVTTQGKIYMPNIGSATGTSYMRWTTGGQINVQTSDIRLKKNINNWEFDSLGFLNDLQLKTYDRIDYDNDGEIGWIANDVQQLMPDMVDTDPKGYLMIKEPYFMFHHHRAIQQLNEKVELRDEKIQDLEERLQLLEDKIELILSKS